VDARGELGDVAGFDVGGARQGVKPGDRLHQAPALPMSKAVRTGVVTSMLPCSWVSPSHSNSARSSHPRRPGVAPDQFDQRVIIDPLSSVQR